MYIPININIRKRIKKGEKYLIKWSWMKMERKNYLFISWNENSINEIKRIIVKTNIWILSLNSLLVFQLCPILLEN